MLRFDVSTSGPMEKYDRAMILGFPGFPAALQASRTC
jgi:hypothetical protein